MRVQKLGRPMTEMDTDGRELSINVFITHVSRGTPHPVTLRDERDALEKYFNKHPAHFCRALSELTYGLSSDLEIAIDTLSGESQLYHKGMWFPNVCVVQHYAHTSLTICTNHFDHHETLAHAFF